MKIIEITATILTIASLWLLSENNSQGFIVGMFSNLLWIYWAHEEDANGILLVNGILIFLNLNGLGAF